MASDRAVFLMRIVKNKFFLSILCVILFFLLGVWLWPFFSNIVMWNGTNVYVLQAAFSSDDRSKIAAANLLKQQIPINCRANWLLSQIYDQERQFIYETVVECSQDYWPLVSIVNPTDLILSTQAVSLKPDDPMAWLWLAQSQNFIAPNTALLSYLKVVQLDPYNGIVWCKIGNIYQSQSSYIQAKDAFLNCCRNEDPGQNGCYNAGRLAEMLGDPIQAIVYYRMSTFSQAIDRANELENKR